MSYKAEHDTESWWTLGISDTGHKIKSEFLSEFFCTNKHCDKPCDKSLDCKGTTNIHTHTHHSMWQKTARQKSKL